MVTGYNKRKYSMKEHNCPMRKRYYIASGAQVNYRGKLVNSRTGIHPDAKTIAKMDKFSRLLCVMANRWMPLSQTILSSLPSKREAPSMDGFCGDRPLRDATNFFYPYFRHIAARAKCRRAKTAQAAFSTAKRTTHTVFLKNSQRRRKRNGQGSISPLPDCSEYLYQKGGDL